METTIYYVRHGEIKKPKDAWAGIINLHFGLSENGKKQIRKAGQFLSKRKIKEIYASPINRAYESAKIISKYFPKEVKITKSKQLFEWKIGWKGKTESEIAKSPEAKMCLTNPTKLGNGEKLIDLAKRMQKFCKNLIKKHKGEEIVCISHQDPIRALRLKSEGKNLDLLSKVKCDMGSITIFYFNGDKLIKTRYLAPKWKRKK